MSEQQEDVVYKGTPTNRHLKDRGYGTLDLLSLTPSNLLGKKILDIGIGGGRAVEEAVEMGIDVVGFDILPTYTSLDIEKIAQYDARDARLVRENLRKLKTVAKRTKRVVAGDATKTLPFANNTFDFTVSCFALPEYSKTEIQAKTAIDEMIRVSWEKAVFTLGTFSNGKAVYGIEPNQFEFDLLAYLNSLRNKGISYEFKTSSIGEISVHIDVSKKQD